MYIISYIQYIYISTYVYEYIRIQGRCNAAGAIAELCVQADHLRSHVLECNGLNVLISLLMT